MFNILYFDPKYNVRFEFCKNKYRSLEACTVNGRTENFLNTTWGSGGHKIDISNANTKSIFVRSLLLSLYVLL